MPPLLDLVLDSKLRTRFADDRTTVHTYLAPDEFGRRITREEHWKWEQRLGQGGFGLVQLEKCVAGRRQSELRAVKILHKQQSPESMDFNRELEAIAKFSHERYNSWFVKSYGWYEDSSSIFISMEYCRHGDLHQYLSANEKLPVEEAQQVTWQILEGLHEMHTNDFAHRDLKPGNVLIKSKPPNPWWVKIADFGISKRAIDGSGPSTVKGTELFMAPEMRGFIDHPDPNAPDYKASDMWSLGQVVNSLITGRPYFKTARNLMEYCQRFPTNLPPILGAASSTEFVVDLMAVDPRNRMSTTKALDHDWMKSQRLKDESSPHVNAMNHMLDQLQLNSNVEKDEYTAEPRDMPSRTTKRVKTPEASASWTGLSPNSSTHSDLTARPAVQPRLEPKTAERRRVGLEPPTGNLQIEFGITELRRRLLSQSIPPLSSRPEKYHKPPPQRYNEGGLPNPAELSRRIEEARTSAKILQEMLQSTPPADDLVPEFVDRCQVAQRSIQGFMDTGTLGPGHPTLYLLYETNQQLTMALLKHSQALLSAQRSYDTSPLSPRPPPAPATLSQPVRKPKLPPRGAEPPTILPSHPGFTQTHSRKANKGQNLSEGLHSDIRTI